MKQASLLFVYKAEQGNNIVTVARYGGTILSGWCKGKACHFEQKKKCWRYHLITPRNVNYKCA